jgi:hypothetical protein
MECMAKGRQGCKHKQSLGVELGQTMGRAAYAAAMGVCLRRPSQRVQHVPEAPVIPRNPQDFLVPACHPGMVC